MLGKRLYHKNKKAPGKDTVKETPDVIGDMSSESDASGDLSMDIDAGEEASGKKKKKSILTKQLGSGSAMPTKRHINLYVSESQKKKVDTKAIAIVAVYLLAVLIFVKFLILDTMAKSAEVKKNYQYAEDNLEMLKVANSDFEEVLAEYSRFGNNFMKPDELAQRDRMEILDLIDRDFMGKDGLVNVNISGNAATMEITSELLADVSSLVKTLEEEPIVYYVTVSSAATQKSSSQGDEDGRTIAAEKDVSATLTVYFVDQNAENEKTEESTPGAAAPEKAGGN